MASTTQRKKKRPTRWADQQSIFFFRVVYVLVGIICRVWLRRFTVVGREHIPRSGGVFVIANHASFTDPFILGYAIRDRISRGPGKQFFFTKPVLGYLMRKLGIFPIQQEMADAAAVRTMVELYRAGGLIIVFPEGGRSETGELQPFFPDFARLMIRLKAPVIPAGMVGPYEVLPMGGIWPQRGVLVAVAFGPPCDLTQFYERTLSPEVGVEAAEYLRGQVAAAIAKAEAVRHNPPISVCE